MDNVSNHEYPSENCFEDAYWSTINGKFYSNLACENHGKPSPTPPPIDPRATQRNPTDQNSAGISLYYH